ncbi:hypothetical protein LTR66_002782 [Elasticomyces elasticus]|nr:hypothetical protein LTR66_002782 [Elasticomyces elasticus]
MLLLNAALLVAAVVTSGAYAQNATSKSSSSITSAPVSYMTVTFNDCDTTTPATMITVTNGITVTYCPLCEMQTATPTIPHTTVYTTAYLELCSTGGMTPKVYTVTESCTEATPTWSSGPSHIPQGFTTTETVCTMCAATPVPVTLTIPCESSMAPSPTGGAAPPTGASPTAKPVTQISDGQVQMPGPTPAGGAGSAGSSVAGAPSSAPPYPMTTSMVGRPAGGAGGPGASNMPSGVSYGNTSGITPWTGGAGSISVSHSFFAAAVVFFSLAVLL